MILMLVWKPVTLFQTISILFLTALNFFRRCHSTLRNCNVYLLVFSILLSMLGFVFLKLRHDFLSISHILSFCGGIPVQPRDFLTVESHVVSPLLQRFRMDYCDLRNGAFDSNTCSHSSSGILKKAVNLLHRNYIDYTGYSIFYHGANMYS